MRVSVDSVPGHGRTLAIADFLKKLEAASPEEIAPQLFDNGQYCPDCDVIKALVLSVVAPEDLAEQRRHMMAEQNQVAQEMKIPAGIVAWVAESVATIN